MRLTPADIADSTGALRILEALKQRWPWIKHLFADGAYDRRQLLDQAAFLNFVVEVVRRLAGQGFTPLPRRCGRRAHLQLDDALAPTGARL